jgi:hypothetical protein
MIHVILDEEDAWECRSVEQCHKAREKRRVIEREMYGD